MDTDKLYFRIERWGPWGYALLLMAAAVLSHFAILSNDSFPLRWQSEHLSLHQPESFYDAFFPIGYPVLLCVAAWFGSPFGVLEVLQILLAALYFKHVTRFASSSLGKLSALLALPFLLFAPQLLRAELSSVPDFLAALCVLLALSSWMSKTVGSASIRAGCYLGIGLLFRTHVLALLLALTLALVLLEGRPALKRILKLWIGAAPFVLFQGIVQLWSGHQFFESGQAFNLWKTMHGVDWSNPGSPVLGPVHGHFMEPISQVVLSEPEIFLRTYATLALRNLLAILSLLVYLVSSFIRRTQRKPLTVLALAALFYTLITLPGGSARAATPILPIVIVSVLSLYDWLFPEGSRSKVRAPLVVGISVVLTLVGVIAVFFGATRAGRRIESYNQLQTTLGLKQPSDARSVYSDDFALYFPNLNEATPRTSGGWMEIGLPQYLEDNPHIPDSSPGEWYRRLQLNHISSVALRVPPINPRVALFAKSDTVHFLRVPFDGVYEVYRLR